MLLVNEILHGRYRILRQLGHGGMGAVYEAHDNVFDTTCALKEIMIATNSQNAKQQEMLLRAFEREAKILAKIKHEVVPHVRDYFTDTNRQFLVMELVEGKDLGGLLEERQIPFPLEDVLRWMDQLLDGLDYLHTQNPPIYHRDLKPQNLKITPRGKIKLLDFGIAKGGAEPPNSTTINNQTFVAATLNYSPIEQIFRVLDPVFREVLTQRFEAKIKIVMEQNADARSDLYALGATAYHLLTCVLPIDALKRTLEVWSNKADPLQNPMALNKQIPFEISAILLKAMEVDHDKRYVSAIEMQQALQNAVAAVKTRENEQSQDTIRVSDKDALLIEQERQRLLAQQQTRLPEQTSPQNDATQQMSAEQLKRISQQSISEQTLQRGDLGYQQNFGQQTNNPQTFGQQTGSQPPNNNFNTGTNPPPFNPANNQYQTGGQQQTEMANFSGNSTGGNAPPNYTNNQNFTGNPAYANNQNTGGNAAYLPQQVAPPKKSSKIFWILPLILLLFLGVAGAGAGIWYWQSQSGITENVTPTPTATATATATVKTSVTATPASTPSTSPTVNVAKDETPKPTVEPTAIKPVINNPTQVKTPPPVIKIPRPKTPTPKRNSDCIFTGDC